MSAFKPLDRAEADWPFGLFECLEPIERLLKLCVDPLLQIELAREYFV